ncbi:hypothetical protein Tco_1437331 [Tanacetum coccineum]
MNQNFYNSNSSGFDQFQPPLYSNEAILLQEQAIEEKQELLAEEQATNPSEPSPISYFYNANYDNISTLSTTYTIHLTKSSTMITNHSEPTQHIYHNHDIFYDGDDDEELFPDEVKRIQQILERTSFDAITPDFPITDSLSIGDEHLSTILETELGELIKSSVENLVPTLNESEDLSDIEKLNSDAVIESFSPSPIPVEGSDSLMEEIDIFLTPDDSMPPGIENDDYESEGDILFLEELLSNDSPSLPENESFNLILLTTQPTLCSVIDTLLPFSSKNEDKVHLLSHRGFKAFQLFFESPMMIYEGNIPTLDVPIAPDYEASRARGFVLRSLELESFS